MRLALAGKGGVGKTTISATLARLHARAGHEVLAIDADSNPNLAIALGMPAGAGATPTATPAAIPPSLVSRRLSGPRLSLPIEEVLDGFAAVAPDGVRLLSMGAPAHAAEGCLCSAHAAVSALLADLETRPDITVVTDLEASPEHLSRGTARHVDVLLLVTEAYYRSLEATRRLAELAAELPIPHVAVVANKVRSERDSESVREFCRRHGLDQLGELPWSTTVLAADADGRAAADVATEKVPGAEDGLVPAVERLRLALLAAGEPASGAASVGDRSRGGIRV